MSDELKDIILIISGSTVVICFLFGIIMALTGKIETTGNRFNHVGENKPPRRRKSQNHSNTSKQADYDPFDNHWESSFDWKDENNDGYDDRDDGFWNEREF